jgi:hypothetical protein
MTPRQIEALHTAARQLAAAGSIATAAGIVGEVAQAFEVSIDAEGTAAHRLLATLAELLTGEADDRVLLPLPDAAQ